LLHEAIGHGLEGDFNRKGSSAFQAVSASVWRPRASLAGRRHDCRPPYSLNVDDEGNASQRNVLIEDGILKGTSRTRSTNASSGVKPTGNGRRESYAHTPMPRMTNTYMLAGDKTLKKSSRASKKACMPPPLAAVRWTSRRASLCFGQRSLWLKTARSFYPVKAPPSSATALTPLTRVTMMAMTCG
jgi:TldD protein